MDDQVPFKVYTFWRDGSKPEVRRFGADKNVVTNYNYLFAKIQEAFPNLKEKKFCITWKDDDGDNVKVSSDEEVMTMLTALRETVVKLYVVVDKSAARPDESIMNRGFGIRHLQQPHAPHPLAPYPNAPFPHVPHPHAPHPLAPHPHALHPQVYLPDLHVGVVCDGCQRNVYGFRYKCITCDNYDLCGMCEISGFHHEHCVLRIPNPQMPTQMVKESIKKSRDVLKSMFASAARIPDSQKKEKVDKKIGCSSGSGVLNLHFEPKQAAAKDRREERREERQEKRQERQERQEKRREERQEERRERRENPREPRANWMDTFAKYLDQFANLAVDHAQYATTTEDAQNISSETVNDMVNNRTSVDLAEMAEIMKACMKINHNSDYPLDVLNRMRDDPKSSFGQEEDNQQDSSSSQQESVSQDPASPQAPTFQPADNTANELPAAPRASNNQQGLGVLANPLQFGVDDVRPDGTNDGRNTASAEIMGRDPSPDKTAEDWTMINKEKDMDSDNGVVGSANKAPLENNLPEEFQPRSGASHGMIYPPLNTATAVYDPKDSVVIPTKTETDAAAQATVAPPRVQFQAPYAQMQAGQSSASAAAGPAKPSAPVPEVPYHRVPHIDAAIRQMISMGFTNEGGWLTQLLENKDGNIAAVLDLLTPVNPHRK